MILLKQEIGLCEADYTLLKELFGQPNLVLDKRQKSKLHKLVEQWQSEVKPKKGKRQ
jgi:hypothetical protein